MMDKEAVCNIHHPVPNPEQAEGEFYPKTLFQRMNEALEQNQKLEALIREDPLTGLINRRYATAPVYPPPRVARIGFRRHARGIASFLQVFLIFRLFLLLERKLSKVSHACAM